MDTGDVKLTIGVYKTLIFKTFPPELLFSKMLRPAPQHCEIGLEVMKLIF